MPAMPHTSKSWAVGDIKIYPVLTDLVGNSMTYGAAIDVFGAKAITPTSNVTTAELWGDNQLLEIDTMLKSIDLAIDYAELNFDVDAAAFGGSVVDASTTPTRTTTWSMTGTPTFGYFKVEARPYGATAPIADIHYVWAKCKAIDLVQWGLVEEGYQVQNLKIRAVQPYGTDPLFKKVAYETATALSA